MATPNWPFIAGLEGRDILTGYVPNPKESRSGVTIATGVDIGQIGGAEFLSLPPDLRDLLAPYRGLVGQKAVEALRARPLVIAPDQAVALDLAAEAAVLGPLRARYDAYTRPGCFDALPEPAATVLCSVAYQFGNLAVECPRFWGDMIRRAWADAVGELRAFGDAYATRHGHEADYLSRLLPSA